jgi:hypothetical protein
MEYLLTFWKIWISRKFVLHQKIVLRKWELKGIAISYVDHALKGPTGQIKSA